MIKIAVVVTILLFMLEPLAINFQNFGGGNQIRVQQKQGNAILLLESYEDYLTLEGNESYAKILNENGIEATYIRGRILVETEDPYKTYKRIKQIVGVNGSARANFVIKEVNIEGKVSSLPPITLAIEPVIMEGSELSAIVDVLVDENNNVLQLLGLNPLITEERRTITFKILNKSREYYKYEIPWEKRKIAKEYGVEPNNIVIINTSNLTNLTTPEFVEYFGESYIIVNENTTKEEVESYYSVISYPNTTIISEEELEINVPSQKIVSYVVVNDSLGIIKELNSTVGNESINVLEGEATVLVSLGKIIGVV